MWFRSLRAMFEVGICFPKSLDSNAQIPGVGEYVNVTYSDARTFSDPRYELIGEGDPVRTRAMFLMTSAQVSETTPLDLKFPADDPIGASPSNKSISTPDPVESDEKYLAPFGPDVLFEMMDDWGSSRGHGHHNGLDLVVISTTGTRSVEEAAYLGMSAAEENGTTTAGGLGAPIVTIGRAKIKSVKCCDTLDRFPLRDGIQSFERCSTTGGRMGKLITRENLYEYAQITQSDTHSRNAISRIAGGSLGSSPTERNLRRVQAYINETPENQITLTRNNPSAIREAGSISGFTGNIENGDMPLMENISFAPTCVSNVGRYSKMPYGPVYYFTHNHGSGRTGTMVEYELLDGPLASRRHKVRCMHLAAVSPALLAAWIESTSQGVALEVPAGTEIGLLGSHACVDSAPHLHIDFGRVAGVSSDALDPGCFFELGESGNYWCCSDHRRRSSSHHCHDRDIVDACVGSGGTNSSMCHDRPG